MMVKPRRRKGVFTICAHVKEEAATAQILMANADIPLDMAQEAVEFATLKQLLEPSIHFLRRWWNTLRISGFCCKAPRGRKPEWFGALQSIPPEIQYLVASDTRLPKDLPMHLYEETSVTLYHGCGYCLSEDNKRLEQFKTLPRVLSLRSNCTSVLSFLANNPRAEQVEALGDLQLRHKGFDSWHAVSDPVRGIKKLGIGISTGPFGLGETLIGMSTSFWTEF